MARQSRSRSSSRAAPARSQPSRSASTQAAPPARAPAPASGVPATQAGQQGKAPGMLQQMATTAGGVAMGSVVGHGLSSMLFGGSSSAPAETAAAPVSNYGDAQQNGAAASCSVQAKDFTQCLNASGNDFQACSFYLDQLKACQAAAAPY